MKAQMFRVAWKWLPKFPRDAVIAASGVVADAAWLANVASVQQLAKNLESFSGEAPSPQLVRQSVRAYFRAFAEQLTLPGWSEEQLLKACRYTGIENVQALTEDGPVIVALTHSGNWDVAGAWFSQNIAPVLTVAEKLDPPDLFDSFVAFRESLGMEIIGVGKGDHVFDQLVERARGRQVLVPLLADRDISGSGVEVQLGEKKALVAAGPAALALKLGRPLIVGHLSHEKDEEGNWRVHAHFLGPIEPPAPKEGQNAVEALTAAWVEAVADLMADHLVDWHMMQKLFVEDLDPERLARARARSERARKARLQSRVGAMPGDHVDYDDGSEAREREGDG